MKIRRQEDRKTGRQGGNYDRNASSCRIVQIYRPGSSRIVKKLLIDSPDVFAMIRTMRIVLTGIGGQGILFTTRVLAEAAIAAEMNVLCTETLGMSQRGGSVIAHMKIGDYHSPTIRKGTADGALCLTISELTTALAFLKPGGLCFVNAAESQCPDDVKDYIRHQGIVMHWRDANAEAVNLGNPRYANQILLGVMAAHLPSLPSRDRLVDAIRAASPAKAASKNIEAFNLGCQNRG